MDEYEDPTEVMKAAIARSPGFKKRPDLADLYAKLAASTEEAPDYSGVQRVAQARADKSNTDLARGLGMQMFGGKTMAPTGRQITASAIEQGIPLRANASDVGYYDPATGEFVENPAMRQGRTEKSLLAQIAGGERALSSEAALQERKEDRLLREAIARNRNTTQIYLGDQRAAGKSGKPLPVYLAKEVKEVFGNRETLSRLESTFKDDYSGDLIKSAERKVGQTVGGMAPQSTQDMTRWWSDQSYFDELPQRHAIFGATLTNNEQKAWSDASINPSLSPSVVRERLAVRKQIYNRALGRMKDETDAAGYNVGQFNAITGGGASGSFDDKPAPAKPKTVVREVPLKDGRIGVEYSDGTRGFK